MDIVCRVSTWVRVARLGLAAALLIGATGGCGGPKPADDGTADPAGTETPFADPAPGTPEGRALEQAGSATDPPSATPADDEPQRDPDAGPLLFPPPDGETDPPGSSSIEPPGKLSALIVSAENEHRLRQFPASEHI